MASKAQFVIQHLYGNKWKTDATMTDREEAIAEAERAKATAEGKGDKGAFRVVQRTINERFGTVQEDIIWGLGKGKENTVTGATQSQQGKSGKSKKSRASSKHAMRLAKFTLIRAAIVVAIATALIGGLPYALELLL